MALYSFGGKPYVRRGDQLWRNDGIYVGHFKGDMIFDARGRYIGEIHKGRLGFNPRRAVRVASARAQLPPRPSTLAPPKGSKGVPPGWKDFET